MARNFNKAQVLEAIKGCNGIMTYVSKKLNCDWSTAQSYVKKWKDTVRAFQDETETVLDKAEQVLLEKLNTNDEQTAKWLLVKKGKHRGYGEALEIHRDESPLNINFEGMTREQLQVADNVEIGGLNEESAAD